MTPTDAIADDELILRHIPGGTTFQKPDGSIASPNFRLRPGEDGISVSRLAITSPEAVMARLGDPETGSRIAVARAGDIRALGFEVVPDPKDYDSGHAELRPTTADASAKQTQKALALLFRYVSSDEVP